MTNPNGSDIRNPQSLFWLRSETALGLRVTKSVADHEAESATTLTRSASEGPTTFPSLARGVGLNAIGVELCATQS